ncbi:unnamed protein product [Brassica rapa]|uniref:S-protein homolog n=1 Tax=Brassica campestris TaxID=3711 RepID=A0A8D9H0K5_BRACM|nr:unnamed protein product [Brassica rapa]
MFRLTIILILLSVYTEQASGGSFFLYNQVRHGVLMKVHCKSGDSDRGWHVRKYGGFYGFDFKDHILDKTLYWCNVWSGPNFSRNASFVAYESKLVCTEQAIGGSFFIYNQVRHGSLMKVHCKSKDNDMGWHVRKYGGVYGFDFNDNLFGTTLFWCNIWQGPHLEHFQVIVAFESRQYPHDLNAWIRWSVRGDGIYQSINGATWKFKYHWDNKL